MDTTKPVDDLEVEQVEEFVGRFVQDLSAAIHATTVLIGDRLGLYAAMGDGGPVTAAELAARAGIDERYAREWLCAQAAAGYVTYDPAASAFTLPPEHAFLLIEGTGAPANIPAAYRLVAATVKDEDVLVDAYRTGKGVGWHQHHHDLFVGTDRFFRPGYAAHLVAEWLPALDGVVDKLDAGVRVADIGCGLGSSTVLMAQAFPRSTFVGSDYHRESIELARKAAADAGVADRATFEVATANDFTGDGYELVTIFDALHDMGDPVGAARHVLETLAPDGTWMIVEPYANDRLEDNLNPVGRTFYSASSMICTPASRAQEVGLALGAQAGEARIRDVVTGAGFSRFRRAAQTPFNLIYEARP